MTKIELVKYIAEGAGLSEADAQRAVDCYHQGVGGQLAAGNEVAIKGFGSFSVSDRSARTGRNPQTGEAIEIPASRVMKFKPSKALKDLVRGK